MDGDAWVPRHPVTAALLVGDLAIIVIVLSVGLLEHGVDPLSSLAYTAQTSLPFVIGWLLVAPIAGAYAQRSQVHYGWAIGTVALAWAGAAAVGALLRATTVFPGGASPTFVVVLILSGLVGLWPWRLAVVFVLTRRRPAARPGS